MFGTYTLQLMLYHTTSKNGLRIYFHLLEIVQINAIDQGKKHYWQSFAMKQKLEMV